MIKTVLVPGAPWPSFTPHKAVGAPHKVDAPRRLRYYVDLYTAIRQKPGATTKELADMHSMTRQHTSRRVNMLIADQLVKVVHVKAPKRNPVATFYATEDVCGMH